mmetsp:Transcript_14612/g.19222  ORF Transcript_14612/g.19222 Transcript_14612/m.19222 type:complete len:249 (+) Transcript_14612:2308-3054(+)
MNVDGTLFSHPVEHLQCFCWTFHLSKSIHEHNISSRFRGYPIISHCSEKIQSFSPSLCIRGTAPQHVVIINAGGGAPPPPGIVLILHLVQQCPGLGVVVGIAAHTDGPGIALLWDRTAQLHAVKQAKGLLKTQRIPTSHNESKICHCIWVESLTLHFFSSLHSSLPLRTGPIHVNHLIVNGQIGRQASGCQKLQSLFPTFQVSEVATDPKGALVHFWAEGYPKPVVVLQNLQHHFPAVQVFTESHHTE